MSLLPRLISTAAAAAVAVALLTSCSTTPDAAPPASSTVTVSSAYGDVTVPAAPERVAAVSYDTPWQLMSLDVQPVATIDYSRWIDDYNEQQQAFIADAEVIGTYGEINYEALAATDPDLIIGDAYEVDETAYARLSDIAPTVIVGGDARGDWSQITQDVAAAVSRVDSWDASKASYEELRDTTVANYADVIKGNTWINFSFGDDAGQFSVQLPTGSTGNLVVNELGLTYGAGVPTDDPDNYGYVSLPVEQLPTVFDGVTVALTFAQSDGAVHSGIQDIIDSTLFQSLAVAQSDRVYGLTTSVTDYVTAQAWIEELTTKVLEPLSE